MQISEYVIRGVHFMLDEYNMGRMDTRDFLNLVLAIAIIVLTSCIIYATYYFVQALKSMTQLTDDLDQTAQSLKNKVQMKALAAIPALLIALASKVIKRKRG